MPEYNIKEIVDAVAADLAANVTLPTHRVHLYTKARSLRLDEVANWLQVYPEKTINQLVSTGSEYYDHEQIVVSWTTETFDEASFNDGNPDKAAQHLANVMAIQERLNEWGDGVPGLFLSLIHI